MSLVQRDYILRLIEAVAAAIARILRRKEVGDLIGARREVYIACTELLGPLASVVMHADARTAADLLGDARRVTAWARLLIEDADILRLLGQADAAAATDRRALTLLLEARQRETMLDEEARRALETLRARVDPALLEPRYRELLSAGRVT